MLMKEKSQHNTLGIVRVEGLVLLEHAFPVGRESNSQ